MEFRAPDNFKKGGLIAGKYRGIDLLILIGGSLFSLVSIVGLLELNVTNIYLIIVLLLPAVLGFTLTLPFGVYHNLMMYLSVLFQFLMNKKKWYWEGNDDYESIQEKE